MSNTYKKGDKYEIEVLEILKELGFTCFRQHRKAMFTGPGRIIMVGADVFGCDIIAKHEDHRTCWIQVSTLENRSKKIKTLKKYPWHWVYDNPQFWGRVPGKKEYRIFNISNEEIASVKVTKKGVELTGNFFN